MKRFFVYIVECADSSLYIGSTNDLAKRMRQHNGAKSGAKYTSGRRPVVLAYSETLTTYAKARAREGELKRLTRTAKFTLIRVYASRTHATISALSARSKTMGKGDNSQRKEKKKPKKDKAKK